MAKKKESDLKTGWRDTTRSSLP